MDQSIIYLADEMVPYDVHRARAIGLVLGRRDVVKLWVAAGTNHSYFVAGGRIRDIPRARVIALARAWLGHILRLWSPFSSCWKSHCNRTVTAKRSPW